MMQTIRLFLIRILRYLEKYNRKCGLGTITKTKDGYFTSDNFQDEMHSAWIIRFEEPVSILELTMIMLDNELPVTSFHTVLGEESEK